MEGIGLINKIAESCFFPDALFHCSMSTCKFSKVMKVTVAPNVNRKSLTKYSLHLYLIENYIYCINGGDAFGVI